MPKDFWVQLLGRMSVPGVRLFGTTNPDNPQHWLRKDFILRQGELNLRQWHFKLADNPSLTREYVDSISAEFTGLYYRRYIKGEWVQAEGAIYDMWDPDIHVVDPALIPPVSQWLGIGVDYGTTAPFAALLLGLAGTGGGEDGRQPCLYLVSEWRWDSCQRHRQLTDVEYSKKLREWIGAVPIPGAKLVGPPAGYLVIDPSAASFKVQASQPRRSRRAVGVRPLPPRRVRTLQGPGLHLLQREPGGPAMATMTVAVSLADVEPVAAVLAKVLKADEHSRKMTKDEASELPDRACAAVTLLQDAADAIRALGIVTATVTHESQQT